MYIKIEGDGSIIFKLNINWIKNSADNYLKWKWLLCFAVFIDMFDERNLVWSHKNDVK